MRYKPLGCVPLDVYSQMAPVILSIIVEAMEDPKTKRDYEKWKEDRSKTSQEH